MVAEARARLSLDGKPFQQELDGIGKQVSGKFSDTLKNAGRLIAGAFTIHKAAQFVQDALAMADSVDNLSKQVNLSAETVQVLKVRSEEAGVSFDTMRPTINALRRSVEQAVAGNEAFSKSFGDLGISMEDLEGLTTEQVFERITKAMYENQSSALAMASSTKILGAESTRLRDILVELGRDGLSANAEELKKLGLILDNDTVRGLDAAEESVSRFMRSVKNTATIELATVIEIWDRAIKAFNGTLIEYDSTQQAVIDTANRKVREWQDAQRRLAEEDRRFLDLLGRIQESYYELAEEERARVPVAEQLNKLRERERELAETINQMFAIGSDQELARVEAMRERPRVLKEIADLEAQINRDTQRNRDLLYELADVGGKIALREEDRVRLQSLINKHIAEGTESSTEALQARVDLKRIDSDIVELNEQIAEGANDGADAANKHLQSIIDMRDNLAKMSEDELAKIVDDVELLIEKFEGLAATVDGKNYDDVVASLRKLATDLDNIPKPNLQWLRDLANFRLPPLFTERQAGQVADAIKDFADRLKGLDPNLGWLKDLDSLKNIELPKAFVGGKARSVGEAIKDFAEKLQGLNPDLSWLKELERLKHIELPPGLTTDKANDAANAIRALIAGFSGINDIDLAKLEMAVQLIDALGKAGPGGQYDLEITMPEGFENGIPLVVPDSFESTLNEISGSLRTLANLKGIAWY